MILKRLSEIALKRAGYDFRKLPLKRALWESRYDWLVIGIGRIESASVIASIPRLLSARRGADPSPLGIYVSAASCLVTDCRVNIEIKCCVLYGLSEGNSVLLTTASPRVAKTHSTRCVVITLLLADVTDDLFFFIRGILALSSWQVTIVI